MENIRDKKIIILAHIFTTVPAQDLKEYFIEKKVKQLLFIGHPLFYVKNRPGAYYELYERGRLVRKSQLKNIRLPGLVQYCKDVFLTLFWVLKLGGRWDLMIALDNLNTVSGLSLRTIGRVKEVIYYTIDFVPKRFDNVIMNNIYHYLEKLSVRHADSTWNLTERVAEGREKVLGMSTKKYSKQIVVPIGIWFNRIPRKKFNQIDKHSIIYAGGLMPHQGIQLVIEALPLIKEQIPDVTFEIIGIGSYENDLKKLVKEKNLEGTVSFLGYMEKHDDVEKILSSKGIAAAMYNEELSRWSYYADPSKVKTYIAAGLPVLTTSVTQIAKEIEKRDCGYMLDYNAKAFAKAAIKIFKDEKLHNRFRNNATRFAKGFDWNTLLDTNLKFILKNG